MSDTVPSTKNTNRVRGTVEILPLISVKANDWNANEVEDHVMESIRHGFEQDGWLASQALLIWGSDEHGESKGIIIDGEHRWRAGIEIGLEVGPMVCLDGITEAAAKALTIKMNQKRGAWNEERLADLVAELSREDPGVGLALDLGFRDEEVEKLVAYATGTLQAILPTLEAPPEASSPEEHAAAADSKRRLQTAEEAELLCVNHPTCLAMHPNMTVAVGKVRHPDGWLCPHCREKVEAPINERIERLFEAFQKTSSDPKLKLPKFKQEDVNTIREALNVYRRFFKGFPQSRDGF